MKNLIKAMLLLVIVAGCKKEELVVEYDYIDIIENAGGSQVMVNEEIIHPTDTIERPHVGLYYIYCLTNCKVRINGIMYTKPGVYTSDVSIKRPKI